MSEFLISYWQWITGSLTIAGVATVIWKKREAIWDWLMFFKTFRGRFEKLEDRVMKPISTEARLCPDCDARMKVNRPGSDLWWYRCKDCDKKFPYPAPGKAAN